MTGICPPVLYARQYKRPYHIHLWLGRFLFVLQKGGDSHVLIAVDPSVRTQNIISRHATVACLLFYQRGGEGEPYYDWVWVEVRWAFLEVQ